MKQFSLIFAFLFLMLSACKKDDIHVNANCTISDLDQQPFNTFQVIGTHNSYRIKTYEPIFNLLSLVISLLPEGIVPENLDPRQEWDYTHLPFVEQFDTYLVRSLEIDIYYDPEGGLYANRLGNAIVGKPVASREPALNEPGLKVMHIPHLDYLTHYLTFKQSLNEILNWSNANPTHFPITVMIELKEYGDQPIISDLVLPFTEEAKQEIANEILSVFPENKLITPKDLRTLSTLEASIAANGWPTLANTRGKVIFIAMDKDEIDEVVFGSNKSLTENANHVFKVINNSIEDFDFIKEAVGMGLIVRTRADAGTIQARNGDISKREAAFSSGAQIISTDYPKPDPRHINQPSSWTDYEVQWPGGSVARSNIYTDCYIAE